MASPAGPTARAARPRGVLPLRPMTLGDLLNGATAYVRTDPKTVFGVTLVVVVLTQLVVLAAEVLPPALGSRGLVTGSAAYADSFTALDVLALAVSVGVSVVAGTALTGLLAVVVARAVLPGGPASAGAWQVARRRLGALLAWTGLQALVLMLAVGAAVAVVAVVLAAVGSIWAAVLVSLLLGAAATVALVWLYVSVTFVPALVVLERLPVDAALRRSFAMVRRDFGRVFGVVALAALLASIIGSAVGVPFALPGQLLTSGDSVASVLTGWVLVAIGATVSALVTGPFTAGVATLLYVDSRVRTEAWDLVVSTGLVDVGPDTDALWSVRPA